MIISNAEITFSGYNCCCSVIVVTTRESGLERDDDSGVDCGEKVVVGKVDP